MRHPDLYFRANAGAAVTDGAGRFLAFERVDRPGLWQLPQGGLDLDETPAAASLRELVEETGLRAEHVERIDEYPEWLAYELPPELRKAKLGRGQVQRWFLYRLLAAESAIDVAAAPEPEFRAWRWMRFPELIAETTPFRRPVYRRLAERWAGGVEG